MKTSGLRTGSSRCRQLLITIIRKCKSYFLNDRTEREWAELAWIEAAAELRLRRNAIANGTGEQWRSGDSMDVSGSYSL
jgi:hypothetical protein